MSESGYGQARPLSQSQPLGMQRELLQLVAMLTMLIDHVGYLWFPEQWGLRVIGRIAFPLYAFGIVQGYRLSRDLKGYTRRLGGLALISQLPFMWAFDVWEINVIGTLFVGILALYGLDRFRSRLGKALVVIASIGLLAAIPADYGVYALLLLFIYRYAPTSLSILLLHLLLNMYYWLNTGVVYQHFSLVATAWLTVGASPIRKMNISVPRWLWISFYPGHLLLLVIITWLLG